MLFNLNEFLISVSFALDFVEMDVLGATSNHGKRTAYTSLRIAKALGFKDEELHDIVALAILHDNGVSEKSLHDKLSNYEESTAFERIKEHCTIGENNIKDYPFLTNVKNVMKYHHEKYDGSGFFNLKGDEIPIMSQIICFSDILEDNFDLVNNNEAIKKDIYKFINLREGKIISSNLASTFKKVTMDKDYWNEIKSDNLTKILNEKMPQFTFELSLERIHKITKVFSKIIDSKSKYTNRHSSELSEKVAIMADYYGYDDEIKMKLRIAADLHDLGKLAVPNKILDSPNKLTKEEFDIIKKHTYYTRLALQEIKGFEEITEWASNHHEKLDGSGYPFGFKGDRIDFNSRLVACLDVYQALTEERPYRRNLTHEEAMNILNSMKEDGLIDRKITDDINIVFKK
ncbi:MAG: HD-GYP domain-containing protein [Clostridiaceae bacterium]